MTKFIDNTQNPSKKTTFTKYLDVRTEKIEFAKSQPENWMNVEFLCKNAIGDVFKCWNNDESNFALFFGVKGSEFDKTK